MRASLLLLAAMLGGCQLSQIPVANLITAPAAAGDLELLFELSGRRIQALPEGTSRVEVEVKSDKLSDPVRQTITSEQFVGSEATMLVSKVPVGTAEVKAIVFGSEGQQLAMSGATAEIKPDQTTPLTLVLAIKGQTGGLRIGVDARIVWDAPIVSVPAFERPAIDRAFTLFPPPRTSEIPSWIDTGLVVDTGRSIALTAAGLVGHGNASGTQYLYYGPVGCSTCPNGQLLPTANGLAMVARFVPASGSIETFAVGEGRTLIPATDSALQLGINSWSDASASVNLAGSFVVTVRAAAIP